MASVVVVGSRRSSSREESEKCESDCKPGDGDGLNWLRAMVVGSKLAGGYSGGC